MPATKCRKFGRLLAPAEIPIDLGKTRGSKAASPQSLLLIDDG